MTSHPNQSPALTSYFSRLEKRQGVSKPRAFVASAEGEALGAWGDTTLPLALGGVTRLFTLAMVLREVDRGALTLETPVADILSPQYLAGLCVVGGVDHSNTITIGHLLSHRSGIADYFSPPHKKVNTLRDQILRSDRSWSVEQALEIARHYPGAFIPGTARHVNFSRTNYLLLGEVLTKSTGMSFDALVDLRIISPLGLKRTYVFTRDYYDRYFSLAPVTNGAKPLHIPQALASFGADGALISSAADTVAFLAGFWSGALCDRSWLETITADPLRSSTAPPLSVGVMMAPLPGKSTGLGAQADPTGIAAGINIQTGVCAMVSTHRVGTLQGAMKDLVALMAIV